MSEDIEYRLLSPTQLAAHQTWQTSDGRTYALNNDGSWTAYQYGYVYDGTPPREPVRPVDHDWEPMPWDQIGMVRPVGYGFRCVTERSIRRHPRWQNEAGTFYWLVGTQLVCGFGAAPWAVDSPVCPLRPVNAANEPIPWEGVGL